jgi:bifunctional non-homologous end joining protein LigD
LALKAQSCLIDGEITVCDEHGLPSFDLLRHGPREKPEAILFVFDLLELDGRDFTPMPIEARKQALARLLRKAVPSLQLVKHIELDGPLVFEHACKLGAEGIVSKRAGSRYVGGPYDHWRKVKNPVAPAVKREAEEEWNR